MTEYTVAFGGRVRAAREAAELTQTELGVLLKLTRSSVANVEAGRQVRTAEQVVQLAAVLNVSAAWLLTGDPFVRPVHPLITPKWLRHLAKTLTQASATIETAVEER